MVQCREGTDLPEQGRKIVVEALAGHEAIPERYDNGERKPDGAASRLAIEKPATVDTLISGLGDHESPILRPMAPFALYLEIEGVPPEPIIGFCSGASSIGLFQR
jgi:hypothetical protein